MNWKVARTPGSPRSPSCQSQFWVPAAGLGVPLAWRLIGDWLNPGWSWGGRSMAMVLTNRG